MLFPQNEKNRLNKLKHSQVQEQPGSKLDEQTSVIIQKLKSLALENVFECKAKSVSLNDVSRANDDLENIVDSKQVGDIVWFPILHEFGSGTENEPQINGEDK